VGAGVSASRAAKKAPLGLFFPAGRKRRAAAVRIHPRGCVLGFLQKKKTSVFSTLVFLVGAGGFEQPVQYIYRATGLLFLRFSGFMGLLVVL